MHISERRSTMHLREAVAVLVAVTVGLTACGGGDDSGGESSTSAVSATTTSDATTETTATTATTATTGAETTTTTRPPADPDDVALAESAVLTLGELPAGWAADSSPNGDGGFDEEQMREECPEVADAFDGLREQQGRETGKARAGFVLGDQGLPGIQSNVVVAVDSGIAEQGYTVYTGDDFLDCLMSIFLAGIEDDGSTAGELRKSPLAIDPVGDAASAVRFTVPISANGSEITVFLDYVVLRADRVLHMLLFGSADLFPLPDGTVTQAIAAAAQIDA